MSATINPILNGPYDEPKHFYRTLPDGTLDYTKKEKGRRPYDPTINTPIPVRQGPQDVLFDQQQTNALQIEQHIINLIRKEVKEWRDEWRLELKTLSTPSSAGSKANSWSILSTVATSKALKPASYSNTCPCSNSIKKRRTPRTHYTSVANAFALL